jgi:hypothetical protein
MSLGRCKKGRLVHCAPTELVRKSEAFGYKHSGPPGLRVGAEARLALQFPAPEAFGLVPLSSVNSVPPWCLACRRVQGWRRRKNWFPVAGRLVSVTEMLPALV